MKEKYLIYENINRNILIPPRITRYSNDIKFLSKYERNNLPAGEAQAIFINNI